MRCSLPAFFVCLVLMASCHKNDVDIADLNTNTFDRDYPGDPAFLTIGAIQTEVYAQGVYNKQTVEVQVHPGQFPVPSGYVLRFIELTDPDTTVLYSQNSPGNTFLCSNFQVMLGTEYCYRFELFVGGELIGRQERCGVAQL